MLSWRAGTLSGWTPQRNAEKREGVEDYSVKQGHRRRWQDADGKGQSFPVRSLRTEMLAFSLKTRNLEEIKSKTRASGKMVCNTQQK